MSFKLWKEKQNPTPEGREQQKAGDPSNPITTTFPSKSTSTALRDQKIVPATTATKIKLTILSTALVDALGGPPEFHSRFSFPLVTTLIPNDNFGLPPGVWTDDTSMTLCLARSIARYGFDEERQIDAYAKWHSSGELSAIGRCFDIGNTIARALSIYARFPNNPEQGLQRIRKELSGENNAGNGSLMRIIPVGLVYWRDQSVARVYARRSSQTTHPTAMCLEACEMWSGAIATLMQEAVSEGTRSSSYSKLDLVKYISEYPYQNEKLRHALTIPPTSPSLPVNVTQLEEFYTTYHPILRLIRETRKFPPDTEDSVEFPYTLPSASNLPSSGFVLHTLVAALYCFFATKTFEEGAIMAVNLGNDADTVGAVYAGLAGCWYAAEEGLEGTGNVFWSKRVKEWKLGLVKRNLVEEVAEELIRFEKEQNPE